MEVKKVGFSEGADRQLFEYAFHLGVPMAILTDGQEWSFYLPAEQGRYDERRVYKLDLLERDLREATTRLERYLSYENVCSGMALTSARSDYQNVARSRLIASNLTKAWDLLLREQAPLLLELLAEKVENLCGYRPALDTCGEFFEKLLEVNQSVPPAPVHQPREKALPEVNVTHLASVPTRNTRTHANSLVLIFRGEALPVRSGRDVMVQLFQLLAKEDSGFLERFASRKHGKKRRYLARDRRELYPGRMDLVEQHSVELVPGWWLGTNYSLRNIQEIVNLALESRLRHGQLQSKRALAV